MVIKLLRRFLEPKYGKISAQEIFFKLHQMALSGMNIGMGGSIVSSGEIEVIDYIKRKIETDNVVICDVGANVGKYSLLLHEKFGRDCQIYSFEPSLSTYIELVKNTSKIENIHTRNIALGSVNNKGTLFSNKEKSGLASLYKRRLDHFGIAFENEEQIDIIKLDDFCQKENIDHINFLKLDVEGNELFVLEGSQNLINTGKIDFIQFEFGGCNIDSRTFFQDFYYLLRDRYRIFRIMQDGLLEIVEYKELYEVFITTNYLAERRS